MPYYRKRKFRKKYPSRRRYRRRYRRYGSTRRIAIRAMRMSKPEYKFTSVSADIVPDWNGSLYDLNNLSQGITDTTRVGDSIYMCKCTLRMQIEIGNPLVPVVLRVIMFFDTQDKISTVTDYLSSAGNVYGVVAYKNQDNKYMTKTLYDRSFPLSSNGKDNFTVRAIVPVHKYSQYNQTVTSPVTGNLKLLFISNTNTAGAHPQVVWTTMLSYTDS